MSEFGPIVSSRNPALRSALSALDGFDTAREAAKSARVTVTAHMSRPSSGGDSDLLETVVAALAAGKALPEDLGHQALEVTLAGQRWSAERALLTRASEVLDAAQDEPLRGDLDAAFADLHAQLTRCLTEVPALAADLGSVADPASAIDADLGSQWKAAQMLLAGYRDIRDAQRQLLRVGVRAWRDQYVLVIHDLIGNAVELFPDWRVWKQAGYYVNDTTGEKHYLHPPWPEDETSWPFLVWLATSDAEPWVPTPTLGAERLADALRDPEAEPNQLEMREERERPGQLVDPTRQNRRKVGVR